MESFRRKNGETRAHRGSRRSRRRCRCTRRRTDLDDGDDHDGTRRNRLDRYRAREKDGDQAALTGAPVTTVKERITVGSTVPADVELMAVPETVVTEIPTVKSYRYFRYNDDVVLVDPSSRRVVQIID